MDALTVKDILLLVVGAIVGGIFGLLLTLFIQPLADDKANFLLVKYLSGIAPRRRRSLAGSWSSVWCRDDEKLTRQYEMTIVIKQLGKKVTATFEWHGNKYNFIGIRQFQGDAFITGDYEDVRIGRTYFGAFQLHIHSGENMMSGKWIGFNEQNEVLYRSRVALPYNLSNTKA